MCTGKTVNGAKSEYLYLNGLLSEEIRDGHRIHYSYDSYGHLAAIQYYFEDNTTFALYYVTTNAQGDVLGLYTGAGVQVASYEYDAWGNVISMTDTTSFGIAAINPIRYRGYYFDEETGWYYLQSRYYDPETCRFINADGVISGVGGEILGCNPFLYCFNNPVNMTDFSGRWAQWVYDSLQWLDENLFKPAVDVYTKIGETFGSVVSNIEVEAGWGTGLMLQANVMGISVGGGYDLSFIIAQGSIRNGFDCGVKETECISIGFKNVEWLSLGTEKSIYHSNLCNRYEAFPGHSHADCPNTIRKNTSIEPTFTIIGVQSYFLVGGKFNIALNYKNIFEEAERIWIG